MSISKEEKQKLEKCDKKCYTKEKCLEFRDEKCCLCRYEGIDDEQQLLNWCNEHSCANCRKKGIEIIKENLEIPRVYII